jgi:hypothetical protein
MLPPIDRAIRPDGTMAVLEYLRQQMMGGTPSPTAAVPAAQPPTPETPATTPLPVPPEFMPPPNAAAARGPRRASPVATATPPATPDTPVAPATPATQQTTEGQPQPGERTGESPWERLARFGFAMAASPNPSLFGQIGEAGLMMQRGDRERRQDNLREREVDNAQTFREAQLNLQRAEQAFQQDPNNPSNVARLAQARYYVAMAARAGSSGGGGGGSGSDGAAVPLRGADGNLLFFYPRTGRTVAAPEGAGRPDEPSRAEALFQRDVQQFVQAHRQNPRYMVNPESLMDDANAYAARRQQSVNRPGAPAGGGVPAPSENRVRIPFNPPQ